MYNFSLASNVTSNTLYDPFGSLVQHQGAYDSFGFTGEWAGVTGLQYLRARWYDPGSGRFTQVDPFAGVLELPGTQHPYAYGLNNPLRYTDPSGEVFVEAIVGGAVVGAAFSGIGYVIRNPGQSLGDYVKSAEFWKAVGVGAVSGAAAGAVAALTVSGLGLLGLKAATAGASALIGAISGAFAGGAGQIVANVLTCQKWYKNLGWAMLGGAVFGAVWGIIGYGIRTGFEIRLGRNLRIAPFGNRTGNPAGELPHYHLRGGQTPSGGTTPGQGIGRHRPWEIRSVDTSFLDRFFDRNILRDILRAIFGGKP